MLIDVGVMIGSSADGVDIVFCNITDDDITIIKSGHESFEFDFQKDLVYLAQNSEAGIDHSKLKKLGTQISFLISKLIKEMLESLAENFKLRQIAVHGYTIIHSRKNKISYQLADIPYLYKEFNCPIVHDFRQEILNEGGFGAPLIPLFHQWLGKITNTDEMTLLNIGGISNITIIRKDIVHGWDIGPGNCISDQLMQFYYNSPFDFNGQKARMGSLNKEFLNELENQYNSKKTIQYVKGYPFQWFDRSSFKLLTNEINKIKINPEDAIYTSLYFTKECFLKYKDLIQLNDKLIVFGGGVFNQTLLNLFIDSGIDLNFDLPKRIHPLNMEAACFAWLGFQRIINHKIYAEPLILKKPIDIGIIYLNTKKCKSYINQKDKLMYQITQ
jgi:anhydro-N-acetylmuramic acid kinase